MDKRRWKRQIKRRRIRKILADGYRIHLYQVTYLVDFGCWKKGEFVWELFLDFWNGTAQSQNNLEDKQCSFLLDARSQP